MTDEIQSENQLDLTGQLLIAMPGMGDPRFAHSVVYICSHTQDGAMGLIVNRPADGITFAEILDRMEMPVAQGAPAPGVFFGGPVETSRGFVLHSDDYTSKLQSLQVANGFAMTATQDILEDMAQSRGPHQALFALGYAGWGPGQLESELAQNGWLTAKADPALVFDLPAAEKWEAALGVLGIDPLLLSASAGRA